jgi:hypothetical protein
MRLWTVLRRLLVIVAVVGLVAGNMAMPMASQPTTAMDHDSSSMPCHKHAPDHGKACPFMTLCMALCCQSLPGPVAMIDPPVSGPMALALRNDSLGDSFSPPPLPRPPRA